MKHTIEINKFNTFPNYSNERQHRIEFSTECYRISYRSGSSILPLYSSEFEYYWYNNICPNNEVINLNNITNYDEAVDQLSLVKLNHIINFNLDENNKKQFYQCVIIFCYNSFVNLYNKFHKNGICKKIDYMVIYHNETNMAYLEQCFNMNMRLFISRNVYNTFSSFLDSNDYKSFWNKIFRLFESNQAIYKKSAYTEMLGYNKMVFCMSKKYIHREYLNRSIFEDKEIPITKENIITIIQNNHISQSTLQKIEQILSK